MRPSLHGRRRRRFAGPTALALALALAGACNKDSSPILDTQATRGKQLARELNCSSCHTADGSRAEGPSWKGLAGSTVMLTDGRSVTADDAYLTTAIKQPQVEVVRGYRPMAPVKNLKDDDIAALVAYIKALK